MTEQNSRFVALMSFLAGLSAIFSIIGFILRPAGQRAGADDIDSLMTSFSSDGMFFSVLFYGSQLFVGVFLIAVIIYLHDQIVDQDKYMARYFTSIGLLSMGMNFIWYASILANNAKIFAVYSTAGEGAKLAFQTYSSFGVDPWGAFFALIGLYFLGTNYMLSKEEDFKGILSILGMIVGVGFMLIFITIFASFTILRLIIVIALLSLPAYLFLLANMIK